MMGREKLNCIKFNKGRISSKVPTKLAGYARLFNDLPMYLNLVFRKHCRTNRYYLNLNVLGYFEPIFTKKCAQYRSIGKT